MSKHCGSNYGEKNFLPHTVHILGQHQIVKMMRHKLSHFWAFLNLGKQENPRKQIKLGDEGVRVRDWKKAVGRVDPPGDGVLLGSVEASTTL